MKDRVILSDMPRLMRIALITGFLAGIMLLAACSLRQAPSPPPFQSSRGVEQIRLGDEAYDRGCYETALDHFFRAHEAFTVADDLAGVAMSLNDIGDTYRIMGDTGEALHYLGEARRWYAQCRDTDGLVLTCCNQAAALLADEKPAEAAVTLSQAATLASAASRTTQVALCLQQGHLALKNGRLSQAEGDYQKGLARVTPTDGRLYSALSFAMARLLLAKDDLKSSMTIVERALAADRRAGFHKNVADDLALKGQIARRQGKRDDAQALFERSLKIYALTGNAQAARDTLARLREILPAGAQVPLSRLIDGWLEKRALEDICQ